MNIAFKVLSAVLIAAGVMTSAIAATTVDIVSRIPKFEKFYADAKGLDEATRWSLWQKEYGIAAVMKGMLPYLGKAGADVATRFTFGNGTTGMDRELYCAGWFAVGRMLASGRTFPELARVPESKMIATVRAAMSR